ncbi:hypothetical protein EON67_05425 [archaeon]|nr:MAG: hypothetical protein EON67_05425 [archaeon]
MIDVWMLVRVCVCVRARAELQAGPTGRSTRRAHALRRRHGEGSVPAAFTERAATGAFLCTLPLARASICRLPLRARR